MVKLELSFKSVEEAAKFLQGHSVKEATTSKIEAVVPEVIKEELTPAQKAAKTRKAKKAKKEAEEVVLPTPAPTPVAETAAAVFQSPPVEAAPVVQAAVATPVADTKALLAKGAQLVAEIQAMGIADDQLLPKLQEAYATIGLQFIPMSKLPEGQLPAVVEAVERVVASLRQPPTYV